MGKQHLVRLLPAERAVLGDRLAAGTAPAPARTLTRARILLKADQADGGPAWDDARIAEALGCGLRTAERAQNQGRQAGAVAGGRLGGRDRV